ncbi:nickel pincer cofactor biosynthesis protein LarC, partial [Acidobacteria bacterium AH-259-A15]|nr:nickel pincer cofactor biosynthesis protein LarC [Acidobacteria bacterium AH-259-A15]
HESTNARIHESTTIMKRLLYFDAFNGVSGDMILGALVDLGLPLEHLKEELAKLKLGGYELAAERVERQGIRGINFQVGVNAPPNHHHHHEDHRGRGFTEIQRLIEEAQLDPWVKHKAVAIFRRLAQAEAKVHQTSLEKVHFHEVGAVDAIVDVLGACIGFKYFEVELFYSAPLNLGSGTVTFSHGTWPVPTPATAELVKGFPVLVGKVQGELTTPTGAAIVTTLVEKNNTPPVSRYEKWGFGVGDKEFEEIPNMLRLLLGLELDLPAETAGPRSEAWKEEEVYLLEANIDDMDAQMFGHFLELALKKGALDVYYTPVHMKKNRPALKLSVLCRQADRERVAELIFRETTTLGVRWSPWRRWILDREVEEIETEYGRVGVKIARFKGEVVTIAPEYEDLKAIAERADIPLKTVRQKVIEQIIDKRR